MGKLSRDAAERLHTHRENMAVLTHWLNSTDELTPDAVALLLVVIGAARNYDHTVVFREGDLQAVMRMTSDEVFGAIGELEGYGYLADWEVTPHHWTLELTTDVPDEDGEVIA